ncbi:hypothetical protein D3C83_241180 [compost metagenome]
MSASLAFSALRSSLSRICTYSGYFNFALNLETYVDSTATAAGVTPGTRIACPMVSGRTWFSL